MTQLFDLQPTHNPHRFFLPVTTDLCVGLPDRRFLFGGVGLAASIHAMEQTCERPVIWATAHYLSFAKPGSIVDLDVWVPVEGNQTSQASVLAHVEDRKIITVHAALGERSSPEAGQWVTTPDLPGPDDCRTVNNPRWSEGDMHSRFEVRLAEGRFPEGQDISGRSPDGRLRLWLRSKEGLMADSGLLAVAADYVSVAISNAIGRPAGGNSLDNTIRFVQVEPCEWILCDIRIEAVRHGIVQGAMHLYSERGTLMATASQSLILRYYETPEQYPQTANAPAQ